MAKKFNLKSLWQKLLGLFGAVSIILGGINEVHTFLADQSSKSVLMKYGLKKMTFQFNPVKAWVFHHWTLALVGLGIIILFFIIFLVETKREH